MHPIDFGAGVAVRFLPKSKRVFADGWGDLGLLELLEITDVGPPPEIYVEWERSWHEHGVAVRHGRFGSPVAALPLAADDAFVLEVRPLGHVARMCVLLPAWNDEGFRTRRKIAEGLCRRGIGALMLEAPLYGTRRLAHGGSPIRTVADFALMTRSVVQEGRSLVAWLRRQGMAPGVAGFSMGGSLAATVGATMPYPIALAPLAAAHAPNSVFVAGVLRSSVAWEALGPSGAIRLFDELSRPSVLRIDPGPATTTAVLVGATRDGFVPAEATEAIHSHWPGADMRWIDAGHATLLWRHLKALVAAIGDAFDRVDAAAETGTVRSP
jgi:alpha-beta hydrolase superfamily lysophospholipase